MIGCLRTRVRKQPIIALYFESENELKFYNLEAMETLKWVLLANSKEQDEMLQNTALHLDLHVCCLLR